MNEELNVLVSGASIAGPAVAYWLRRAGHQVTVVERADELRRAGQNVDVRGPGREVLRRMAVEDVALAEKTGELGIRFVDDDDAVLAEFPAGQDDSGGATAELEILRGTLAGILVQAGESDVDYRFGDHIAQVDQRGDRVSVTFASGSSRDYDLVVIAEGVRSRTRRMVFGDIPTRRLGLCTAYGSIKRDRDDGEWWTWFNAVGGRSVTVRPDNVGTTRVALSFLTRRQAHQDLTSSTDLAEQRDMLRAIYSGVGWKVPRILDGVAATRELYVDDLTQVRSPGWVRGRVVLLGDAAWCATPISGMGTTLALTGAYVLAGELASAPTLFDGLAAFETWMRPLVRRAQRLPPGTPRLAHPRTRGGLIALRTALRVAGSRPVRLAARRLPRSKPDPTVLPRYRALDG